MIGKTRQFMFNRVGIEKYPTIKNFNLESIFWVIKMNLGGVKCIIFIMVCVNAAKECRSFERISKNPLFCICRITKCVITVLAINSNEQHTFSIPLKYKCLLLITLCHHSEKLVQTVFELNVMDLKIGK